MLADKQFEPTLEKETLDDIHNWFLLSADYQYRAVMTRRCFNLMELVSMKNQDSNKPFSKVLTENGLLMKAEEIADCYNRTMEFPKIAIIDDLLVHGRSLNRFLRSFWSAICSCLEKCGMPVDSDTERAFNQSITLFIYAVNDTVALLKQEYQWRMQYKYVWPESKWRELSFRISNSVVSEFIANTSYVISLRLHNSWKGIQTTDNDWICVYSEDGGAFFDAYEFYVHAPSIRYGIYPTVRIYRHKEECLLIPYFFVEKMDRTMCADIMTETIGREDAPAAVRSLASLIHRTGMCKSLDDVYGQFICMVCAQITLNSFLKELQGVVGDSEYDTAKIARNFGLEDEENSVVDYLDALCSVNWSGDIFNMLYKALRRTPEASNADVRTVDEVQKELVSAMELVTYRQAVKHERNAKDAEKVFVSGGHVPQENLDKSGEMVIREFLHQTTETYGESVRTVSMLPILTWMMDCGSVSLKIRTAACNTGEVQFVIRNTELSLFIMPQRLQRYYPLVFQISQFFWSEDDFPAIMERHLQDKVDPSDSEKQAYIADAKEFARLMQSNKVVLDSMLNWRSCVKYLA